MSSYRFRERFVLFWPLGEFSFILLLLSERDSTTKITKDTKKRLRLNVTHENDNDP